MDITPDKSINHLTVTLDLNEINTVMNGSSITNTDEVPKVIVSPLSEINPESRKIESTDKARVRKALAGLTCQATVMRDTVIIHVPEAFLQSAHQFGAERLDLKDIIGDQRSLGIRIDTIKIELSDPEGDTVSNIDL